MRGLLCNMMQSLEFYHESFHCYLLHFYGRNWVLVVRWTTFVKGVVLKTPNGTLMKRLQICSKYVKCWVLMIAIRVLNVHLGLLKVEMWLEFISEPRGKMVILPKSRGKIVISSKHDYWNAFINEMIKMS